MIRSALVAFALIFATGFPGGEAIADPYRWCADYGGGRGGGRNCWFMTIEQCRAAISGNGGYCTPNPFYDGIPIDGPRATQRRARPRT